MKVKLTEEAQHEVEAAYDFYRSREPEVAERFVRCIERSITGIQQQPTTYRLIDGEHRRCLVKLYPYAIIYRVRSESIEIIAIAHLSRRPGYWRQPEPE
ncbi:MAG: type II toxin-antitoxin system RelE/ParE family toxin [Verrucomicrobiota bacterium]